MRPASTPSDVSRLLPDLSSVSDLSGLFSDLLVPGVPLLPERHTGHLVAMHNSGMLVQGPAHYRIPICPMLGQVIKSTAYRRSPSTDISLRFQLCQCW